MFLLFLLRYHRDTIQSQRMGRAGTKHHLPLQKGTANSLRSFNRARNNPPGKRLKAIRKEWRKNGYGPGFSPCLSIFMTIRISLTLVIRGQSPGDVLALLNQESPFLYQGREAIGLVIFLRLRFAQHQSHHFLRPDITTAICN